MTRQQRPSVGEADALTSLILEVFRLNGCLISAGDDLVSDLGLTSARWQVLGAMALAPAAETVARLARSMGLRRQGVQRIVNELAAEADDDKGPGRRGLRGGWTQGRSILRAAFWRRSARSWRSQRSTTER